MIESSDSEKILAQMTNDEKYREYIFFRVGECHFGILAEKVQDVLHKQELTKVPLANEYVLGLHNLRGRIVTCLDIKYILDIPYSSGSDDYMMIVFKYNNEIFSFTIDQVISIVRLYPHDINSIPSNLPQNWRDLSIGIYHQEGLIKVILDFDLTFSKILKI